VCVRKYKIILSYGPWPRVGRLLSQDKCDCIKQLSAVA